MEKKEKKRQKRAKKLQDQNGGADSDVEVSVNCIVCRRMIDLRLDPLSWSLSQCTHAISA